MQLSLFDAPPIELQGSNGAGGQGGQSKRETSPLLLRTPAPLPDFRISEADPIGSGGQMAKVKANLAAIKLLKQLQAEGRQATPEEQKQLVLYTGWGHTAQPFHPKPTSNWLKLQEQMRPHFTDEEWTAASASTINAHYTSPEVIRWKWQVIERLGFKGGKILEPAFGVGHYFGLIPEHIKDQSRLYACELDLISGAIAKQLYPSVEVYVGGFETAPYEANYFDLVLSNVPFSDIPVIDHQIFNNGRGHLADTGLHNYYFIRALEIVRPGGLVAFITSRFTMDSLETKVRAYLAEHAHLVGAVRLPVTAFKKNAHTEVTTDVIFLLKKDEQRALHGGSWVETVSKGEYRLNEFYEDYPHMMLGEMQLEGGRYKDAWECVVPKEFDLAAGLTYILDLPTLPRSIYMPALPSVAKQRMRAIEPETFENPPSGPWIREGSYAMDDYYRIWQKVGPSTLPTVAGQARWKRAELDGRQLSRVRGLIEVRDAFREVIKANADYVPDEQLARLQSKLATVYRHYVAKWGFLHEPANITAFSEDPDSDAILALERWNPDIGRADRAAIFSQRLVEPETRPTSAASAVDALAIALRETGQLDFARMIELTDKTQAELVEELGEVIFPVRVAGPDGETRIEWALKDEYLSGNIRQKLAEAEWWVKQDLDERYGAVNSIFERNVRALQEVLPRDVGPKEIFVQLGAPWVPKDIVEQFINEQIFAEAAYRSNQIRVRYIEALGTWRLDNSNAGRILYSAENQKKWGTSRVTALDLIEKCLNNQIATVYDTWEDEQGKEHKTVNQEDTLVARAKQAEIKSAFESWVWKDEQRVNRLVRIYNDRFNSTLPRRWDGSHLTFPGMNPAIILRQIQKDVIWRGLQSKSLLIAHQVGFGKTYSQINIGMRLKQMKLRRRVMWVVKRATYGQIVSEVRSAYPLAHLSTIASGQTPHQRRRQLARIATEDYELIITTHPIFTKISVTPETKMRFLREQLQDLEEAIFEARGDDISTKELEKAKKRLKNKLDKAMEKGIARDPNGLYWEDLGIDALIVDESGAFKNLWFPTTGTKISGIGGTESGRAFDLYLKLQLLREKDSFVAFATGTPLENSISEVYVMMLFLMPEKLRELGLHHFDAWRSTFGRSVAAVEMKPDGSGFRIKERFASFHNLPQLKRLWWEVADIQMDAEAAKIDLPAMVGGKPIGVMAEPYPELKRIIETLANRANNMGDVDPHIDNILKVISDADKASLDARLLGEFPVVDDRGRKTGEFIRIDKDYAGSKVNLCADKVAEIYHATTGIEIPGQPGRYDLAQLIFLDSSTPQKGKWTVYEDLRQKLIARGLKPDEIAFAQDYSDDDKKAKLAAAINAGRIRVAIGHTEIMGIGLNCQRLLVALHHLDCPWKPAWIEQREGRILRQGNLCPEVQIYRYVMAGSFDVYRWQTVERKATFIHEFNSPNLSVLSIEDPGLAVLSAREMTALATGNPHIIEQIELQTRLRTLIAIRKDYDDQQHESRWKQHGHQAHLKDWQLKLTQRQAVMAACEAGGDVEVAEALGRQLYALCEPHFEVYGQQIVIADLYGMVVSYKGEAEEIKPDKAEKFRPKVDRNYWGAAGEPTEAQTEEETPPPPPPKEYKISRRVYVENEEWNFLASFALRIGDNRDENNAGVLKHIFASDMPAKISEAEAEVKDYQRRLVELEKILAEPFTHGEEIAQIEARLQELSGLITAELGEAEPELRQAARVDLDLVEEDASEYPEGYDPDESDFGDLEVEVD